MNYKIQIPAHSICIYLHLIHKFYNVLCNTCDFWFTCLSTYSTLRISEFSHYNMIWHIKTLIYKTCFVTKNVYKVGQYTSRPFLHAGVVPKRRYCKLFHLVWLYNCIIETWGKFNILSCVLNLSAHLWIFPNYQTTMQNVPEQGMRGIFSNNLLLQLLY